MTAERAVDYRNLDDHDPEHVGLYDPHDAVWRVPVASRAKFLVVAPAHVNRTITVNLDLDSQRIELRLTEAVKLMQCLAAAISQAEARQKLSDQEVGQTMAQARPVR